MQYPNSHSNKELFHSCNRFSELTWAVESNQLWVYTFTEHFFLHISNSTVSLTSLRCNGPSAQSHLNKSQQHYLFFRSCLCSGFISHLLNWPRAVVPCPSFFALHLRPWPPNLLHPPHYSPSYFLAVMAPMAGAASPHFLWLQDGALPALFPVIGDADLSAGEFALKPASLLLLYFSFPSVRYDLNIITFYLLVSWLSCSN